MLFGFRFFFYPAGFLRCPPLGHTHAHGRRSPYCSLARLGARVFCYGLSVCLPFRPVSSRAVQSIVSIVNRRRSRIPLQIRRRHAATHAHTPPSLHRCVRSTSPLLPYHRHPLHHPCAGAACWARARAQQHTSLPHPNPLLRPHLAVGLERGHTPQLRSGHTHTPAPPPIPPCLKVRAHARPPPIPPCL